MSLVINQLPFLCCYHFPIIREATKARSSQTDTVSLAEDTIRSGAVGLISTDNFVIVPIRIAIGSCLSFQIFSFIVGVAIQAVKECETITGDRD
jgi:hypothetical protein